MRVSWSALAPFVVQMVPRRDRPRIGICKHLQLFNDPPYVRILREVSRRKRGHRVKRLLRAGQVVRGCATCGHLRRLVAWRVKSAHCGRRVLIILIAHESVLIAHHELLLVRTQISGHYVRA